MLIPYFQPQFRHKGQIWLIGTRRFSTGLFTQQLQFIQELACFFALFFGFRLNGEFLEQLPHFEPLAGLQHHRFGPKTQLADLFSFDLLQIDNPTLFINALDLSADNQCQQGAVDGIPRPAVLIPFELAADIRAGFPGCQITQYCFTHRVQGRITGIVDRLQRVWTPRLGPAIYLAPFGMIANCEIWIQAF